jgi:uncharacterized coiled-coil protein SlyX
MNIVELSEQLTRLEMLYSEQDHTIQALDDIVTRQAREISNLNSVLQLLKQQYQELKSVLPDQSDGSEKPPHY